MNNLTPFIDADGNMRLHAREGGVAVIEFQEDDGTPRNVENASIFFEVEGFRKELSEGEATNQKILVLERGDLAAFLDRVTDYIILDETGDVPHVIIEGKVIISGWV